MYKLQANADLSFFHDATVGQVCANNSGQIIRFDKNIRLTILSAFVVQDRDNEPRVFNGDPSDIIGLLKFIGKSIHCADVTSSGGLRLTFESGFVLEILDDSDQYESFLIENGDSAIIV